MAVEYACVIPHPPLIIAAVGKGEEKRIGATVSAVNEVARDIARIAPDTIVVASPHSAMYGDYIHISPGESAQGSFEMFGAPHVRLEKAYDSAFVSALCEAASARGVSAGTLGEKDWHLDHGTMVPLHFIDQYAPDYRLVRVSISGLSYLEHYRLGMCVADAAQKLGRKTVFVASGDLSHKLLNRGPYGYAPEGPAFDKKVCEAISTGDFGRFFELDEAFCEAAGECGLRAFIEMAGALDGRQVLPASFSYEGPFGVGYGVCGYEALQTDDSRRFADIYRQTQAEKLAQAKRGEDAYVRLARLSLETYVKTGKNAPLPDGLPEDMLNARAGVFVSLKKDGRLRGCIGTIAPITSSVAEEIIQNAVSAGTGDLRFDVVTADELDALVYSVDVLGEPEPISSIEELDVERYGVIVTQGRRCGLLLPNLSGVTSPRQQVNIALQKAGISPGETYAMQRFEVVRHK